MHATVWTLLERPVRVTGRAVVAARAGLVVHPMHRWHNRVCCTQDPDILLGTNRREGWFGKFRPRPEDGGGTRHCLYLMAAARV